jgi:hypothetical protein
MKTSEDIDFACLRHVRLLLNKPAFRTLANELFNTVSFKVLIGTQFRILDKKRSISG